MLPSLGKSQSLLRLVCRFGFRLGEKINLLSDDFTAGTGNVLVVCPFGIMDTSRHHYHGTFCDMVGNPFSGAVEADNPVPFGILLTFAFTIFEARRCRQRDVRGECYSQREADYLIL